MFSNLLPWQYNVHKFKKLTCSGLATLKTCREGSLRQLAVKWQHHCALIGNQRFSFSCLTQGCPPSFPWHFSICFGEQDLGLSFNFSGFWQQSLHMSFAFRLGDISEIVS
jgi:hypothetical protein